ARHRVRAGRREGHDRVPEASRLVHEGASERETAPPGTVRGNQAGRGGSSAACLRGSGHGGGRGLTAALNNVGRLSKWKKSVRFMLFGDDMASTCTVKSLLRAEVPRPRKTVGKIQ